MTTRYDETLARLRLTVANERTRTPKTVACLAWLEAFVQHDDERTETTYAAEQRLWREYQQAIHQDEAQRAGRTQR